MASGSDSHKASRAKAALGDITQTVTSRRAVLSGLGMAALFAPSVARAQQLTIDEILRDPSRGQWNDQFDTGGKSRQEVASQLPILSDQTVAYVESAISQYSQIVGQGGWPVVPATKKMKLGVRDAAVEPLRKRLMISGDLDLRAGMSDTYDSFVDGAVKRFQARHGLPNDGVIGNQSLQAINVGADVRLGQLQTNLVRLRSMAGFKGDRYVMVNIPAAELEVIEADRVVQRHTTVVGKIDRQTPILNSKIHEVILNPTWTAPKSIILKDIIPVMRKDPEYLTRNSIRIFDWNTMQEIPPTAIDWSTDQAANYMLRQDPGKNNAMSSTKINFPNPHAVYMHDTPQQNLFLNSVRFDSSGCVRVHNVKDLSLWLLRNTPGWNRQQMDGVIESRVNTPIAVADPVPLYFTYVTAWATPNGIVHFRDDIYKRDGVDELNLTSTL
ncbi:MAG: L,D-transpeptidase family protein [Phyllobacteriaceae bacterium]|nr:L,D-transpeptidase family protein [Phyllobacteriaceae bacterium]